MKRLNKIKQRVFHIIQIGNKSDLASTVFDVIISILIIISILATFLQTFESLEELRPALSVIEFLTIIVFVIEYLLRLWTADCLFKKENGFWARIKFVFSFDGIVDGLTIFSYFAPFLFSNGMVALRMLRVVRIMRLFKLNSTYDAFNVITDVLKDKKDQLISSIFLIGVMLMASSLCMYSLEHDAQPEAFKNAFSGIWWSVSTMLTVGYGDIYPVTYGGKIMAIIIAFLGVGMVAIPTGIISAGFVEYYTKVKTGSYKQRNADFVALDVVKDHEYIGKPIGSIKLPTGLYIAVIMRDDEAMTPYSDLILKEKDCIIFASTSNHGVDAAVEELELEYGHDWIDKKIKEIDISRRMFIVMIKRNNRIIQPEGSTKLKFGDKLIILDRRVQ